MSAGPLGRGTLLIRHIRMTAKAGFSGQSKQTGGDWPRAGPIGGLPRYRGAHRIEDSNSHINLKHKITRVRRLSIRKIRSQRSLMRPASVMLSMACLDARCDARPACPEEVRSAEKRTHSLMSPELLIDPRQREGVGQADGKSRRGARVSWERRASARGASTRDSRQQLTVL